MVAAGTNYITPFPTSSDSGTKRSTFLWSMMLLAEVDLVLLLWILKPWSIPSESVRLTAANSTAAWEPIATITSEKPSPLGPKLSFKSAGRR